MPRPALTYPIPLVFLVGLSDSGREIVRLDQKGQPQITLTGTCSYMPQLTPGRFAIKQLWLGDQNRRQIPLPPDPLVNYIADPDSHGTALAQAIEIVERTGRRCFNDPRLVAQTRRDQIAQRLADIPGLKVPLTVLLKPTSPSELAAAAAEHGLRYPIIVRLAGDHGGISTIRIDHENAWNEVNKLPWGGRAVYLTEFVDFHDADGLYRKCRIIFTGGKPTLHHVIISREWLVHRGSRLNTPETAEEERYWLVSFDTEHLPRFQAALAEIQRIVGLDYFGLDCHLGQDNVITLFECNATMNVLTYGHESSHWNEPKARIRARLEASLEKFARASLAAAAARG
jgi:glutathione synthase/RimK-type ligase-like ATP-grasp enzyme